MSTKTIKRLVACFGSIQLVTALSVLSYREKEQQEQNVKYENYLVITPLWAPQGQNDEFAAFIEKMAKSIYDWKKIAYMPLDLKKSLAKKLSFFGLSQISSSIHELLGIKNPDELYLARSWSFEDQLLMNVYESAEKICYGNGIGIYTSQSVFPPPSSLNNSSRYFKNIYTTLKEKMNALLFQRNLLKEQEFDIGYFSIPSAFDEVPLMKTVILEKAVYLETLQKFKKTLSSIININYFNNLRAKIENVPTSILLTSNFSEAAGRMSLENEIAAYREFLETQGILKNSILLIKPHPRDSKLKVLNLKSALSDLYSDIFVLSEQFLFYLPFELFFMEVFLNPDGKKLQNHKIFTFSSACLTLELLLDAHCIVGFKSDIVRKFFYQEHVLSRIKHEADLLSTIQEIKHLNVSLIQRSTEYAVN